MCRRRSVNSIVALAAFIVVGAFPLVVLAQCESDEDCRYGRVCQDGQCAYPSGSCQRDVDCPDGSICEAGRCMVAAPSGAVSSEREEQVLPPPRPAIIRGLRQRQTDGGARFVDPIEWGGRGAISPRPHGTSVFEFQYGAGQIPCQPGCTCDSESTTGANSAQLTLGGDSVVGNIVSIGFSMALFRWVGLDGCDDSLTAISLGDVQMRLGVLAYRNSGPNHWFGLTPFIRILMSAGYSSGLGGGYFAILEPGVALGFAYNMISLSLHLSGLVGFPGGDGDTFGGFLSHFSFGVRPINILGIIANLETGYGTPAEPDAVPVAIAIGVRLFLGRALALDVATRIAATEAARYSDNNAAVGLWSLSVRLAIVWRGMGRP